MASTLFACRQLSFLFVFGLVDVSFLWLRIHDAGYRLVQIAAAFDTLNLRLPGLISCLALDVVVSRVR